MKNKKPFQFCILSLFILIGSTSCSKTFTRGSIERNCTGTYLELNKKNFLICNPEITESYSDGSTVKVRFDSKDSCSKKPGDICALYYESHGFVKIIEIK